MNTMKRTLAAAATAFALVSSTLAAAQGTRMTDEQLDQVTAAGALSVVAISNPGKANVSNLDLSGGGHSTCINCPELFPAPHQGKTAGVVLVVNRKFTLENPIVRCVGAGIAGLC
jgi:hypothetical protein